MKKKVLSWLLGTVLLIGTLAGCGGGDAKEAANAAVSDPVQDETEAVTEESVQTASGELETLDIFVNMSWYPVDSFEGIIPDYVKEATGVDLNVTIATDSSQLGVMIGSGEIPDLVFTDLEQDRLSNAKLCYSFTELEEQFGASFDEVGEERKAIARTLSGDGDYYTILNSYTASDEYADLMINVPGTPCIFYRKDLMGQLGNPVIGSADDLMGVLEQCKEAFPDMTPFGLGGVWKLQPIEIAMGVLYNQYNPETGDYYYEATAPGYEDFLRKANEMAKKGYIVAEDYANVNEADGHQKAYNNGCVFYAWYLGTPNLLQLQNESQKINPEAEWAILPKMGDSPLVGTGRGWAGTFVSRKCSNPEAAARLLTYLNSKEGVRTSLWGKEGVEYTIGEDGMPTFSEEFLEARDNNTMNEKYNPLFYLGATNGEGSYKDFAGVDQEILDAMNTYGEGFVNYPAIGIANPSSASDEGVIFKKLEELKKSYEAKVIFAASEEEFNNSYQEFMDALKKTGVETYNSYMTKRIAEVNAEMGFN